MTRYLPVPALWWFPEAHDDGPRRIVVPVGTAVHATHGGRVTDVDDQSVGSIVVRDERERFHHYRRLRASSITVAESDEIEAGAVIGVVAEPNDGSMPAMLYGVHDADDRWIDIVELLAAARDPDVLAFDRVGSASASTTVSQSTEFAGLSPREPSPPPPDQRAPAANPATESQKPPAPSPVRADSPAATPPVSSGSDGSPSSTGDPTAEPDVAADEPAEHDDTDDPPKRSRLAARRRPRRAT